MKNCWLNNDELKCIILCAGKGNRILPHSQHIPKVMIKIANKPILYNIVNFWKQFTNDFIFIVGYKKNQVIDYVKKLPINSIFVEQKKLKGIADAVDHVEEYVLDKFIVVLGDCICRGKFNFPENMNIGIGVWKTKNSEDIKKNYSVEINNKIIRKVIEKPKVIKNELCGMGFYFLDTKVFNYIKTTSASELRNEVEITDVIQNMIDDGKQIKPIFLKGDYLNITFPEDIKIAEKIIIKEGKLP